MKVGRLPRTARARFAAVALAMGCAPELPANLGDFEADHTRLADSEVLAHLDRALDLRARTAMDLLVDPPEFVRAPDPSRLFVARAEDRRRVTRWQGAHRLRILSYNVGLLSRWIPFTAIEVPEIDERRGFATKALLGAQWDVLLLQEVWEFEDVERFAAEAERTGYRIYAGDHHHDEHGLLIAIRNELIDDSAPQLRTETQFEIQRDIEKFPGPWIGRGYLSWRFVHAPSQQIIEVFDSHPVAFPDFWRERTAQARELALAAAAAPEDAIVIVGADLNAGPYYPQDSFGEVDGEPVTGWWRNAVTYPLFMHYGGLVDAFNVVRVPADVQLLDALPPFGSAYKRDPLAGTCREEGPHTFTATDCNSLHFRQFAGTEYPARIDHVMIRRTDEARVVEADIVLFERQIPADDGAFELSDHYGVAVELALTSVTAPR